MDQESLGIAAEAAAVGVDGRARFNRFVRQPGLIEAFLQDQLDGFVAWIAEVIRATAGRLQARCAELLGEAQHALYGAQLDENPIAKERVNKRVAGRPDALRFSQAPLGVVHLPGLCCWRHVIGHSDTRSWRSLADMRCRQFVLVVELHHGGGRLEP